MTPEDVLPHIEGIVAVVSKKVWVSVAGGREGGREGGKERGRREEMERSKGVTEMEGERK